MGVNTKIRKKYSIQKKSKKMKTLIFITTTSLFINVHANCNLISNTDLLDKVDDWVVGQLGQNDPCINIENWNVRRFGFEHSTFNHTFVLVTNIRHFKLKLLQNHRSNKQQIFRKRFVVIIRPLVIVIRIDKASMEICQIGTRHLRQVWRICLETNTISLVEDWNRGTLRRQNRTYLVRACDLQRKS